MTGNPGHKNRRLVSESTVRRERGLLQSIFERAIDEGYDIRNPFRGIRRGKDKPRTRVLTLDGETLLLETLHPRFQRFVRFALGTGRLDEIRGIDSTRDIDWMRGTVHVSGKFRKERDVPMQPDARAALEEQFEEDGKLWRQHPQRLREVLAEGSARAKIPSLTPHVVRHTFGTRWLQAGGDIYKLSKILGHSSVAVTEQLDPCSRGEHGRSAVPCRAGSRSRASQPRTSVRRGRIQDGAGPCGGVLRVVRISGRLLRATDPPSQRLCRQRRKAKSPGASPDSRQRISASWPGPRDRQT